MKQVFQNLCRGWENRLFQMEEFALPAWQLCENQGGSRENEKATGGTFINSPSVGQHSCNDARVIVIGLEILFVEIESDLMTLSTMLKSPHSVDFRLQLKNLVQSLQELEKLLDVFQRYQQMWGFMKKVFSETSFSNEREDVMQHFLQVDETFKEIMQAISSDPHMLNFVSTKTKGRFHGSSLYHILLDGLSTMETISNQMTDLLDAICHQYPRFWFLRDRNMIELLSFHSTSLALQRFVRKCFQGVEWLEIQSHTSNMETSETTSETQKQSKVLGIFGSLQEHISFPNPLEPNPDAILWFPAFEKQLKLTMIQFMKQCVVREQPEPSNHDPTNEKANKENPPCVADMSGKIQTMLATLSDFPLQCVLVAEEAAWCRAVVQAFQESNPLRLSHMKALNAAKLKELGRTIKDGLTGFNSELLTSKYRMMCLRALAHLTMNHSQKLSRLAQVQIPLESSFEWLSLIKYSVNSEDVSQEDNAHTTCYIDVLDHRLQYGFEYFGPEDLTIAFTPSTDQAMLGILLALENFGCGIVSGPRKSGKKTTALHLGKALGRQIVVAQCCPSMTLSVIQNLLLGSLQTGAYLYLDSVNLLTQDSLSILGQHLLNIHQSFAKLRSKLNQRMNEKPKDRTGHNIEDLEYHMEFAGKSISASPSYGCILTSSQWYSSNIPDILQFAMKTVALEYPDHRIIAEVMLTSLGFSDAMSLSHRLVSLLSLARDSHSLPEFSSASQNGFLDILQKIIAASKIHLYQTLQQREISNEACFRADACLFSQVIPENFKETEKKESERLFKLRKSHLPVVRALLEETAIIKAILSVLIPEHSKALQFYTIFKETFPRVCHIPCYQQSIEGIEKNQLQDAVREELQQKQFYNDSQIIRSTLTLYQAMKVSQAVILVGPSGSGKTTCYSALAGALNSLAAKSRRDLFENDKTIAKEGLQICASSWSFVNSFILFPNAMSHEELFGRFCEKRGWRDGAVAKVLRERHGHTHPQTNINEMGSQGTSIVKWLVMDGEPLGQPSWLDYLTTLCSNQSPCLRLPSGETLVLSQSNFKLLIEMTDLDCATPSSVTSCSLVFFTCVDLWKAVWDSEMDALSFEHNLDQGVMRMWNCLAEDLFQSTLSSAIQNNFTSAIQTEGKDSRNPVCGIQEVMSFVRILRALLLHFRKEMEELPQMDKQGVHVHGAKTPGTKTQNKQQLITRDVFLVAYIWGFGGHLHPCHWTKFDTLVRNVLFACRYKIVVPENVSLFDHFFSIDAKIYPKNTMVTSSIIPKNEKYTFLIKVMLEANQPLLLVGEPGSGKSTLCKNLLRFEKPHVSLPASPLLSSGDIRTALKTISHRRCHDTVRSMKKQQCLLLFVDDLHEAPCDVFGKESAALETLRQSISKRETATFDTNDFELLSSETVGYIATCCASGLSNHQSNVMSSRLSRLFSIFVLPDPDEVLPIHPHFKVWLKEIQPKHSVEDLSDCIVTATKCLYYAVRDKLQYPAQQSHFSFSHHDIQKVLCGMSLHQFDNSKRGFIQKKENSQSSTRPPLSLLQIVHLWIHECMRTFNDRLCSEHDIRSVVSLIAMTATTHFKDKMVAEIESKIFADSPTVAGPALHTLPPDAAFTCQPTGHNSNTQNLSKWPKLAGQFVQSVLWSAHTMTQPSHLSQTIYSNEMSSESYSLPAQVDAHVKNVITRLVYGPKLSEACDYGSTWSYQEQDLDALVQELCAIMDRKEEDEALRVHSDHSITSSYIVHRQGATQLLHIFRVLLTPGGHGVLMGSSPGTGRKTTVRLAACLTGYRLIEVHAGNENQLHEILQDAEKRVRVDKDKVIILAHEEIREAVREELLVTMSQRAYPALHPDNELRNLVSRAAAVNNSRRRLMDCWISEAHQHQVQRNIHVFLLMPFIMTVSNETSNYKSQPGTLQAQMAKAVKLSCCVEVYQPWSHQCLVEVAAQCFKKQHYINVRQDQQEATSLSVVMAGIHQSACQYASVLLKYQPFSPSTYFGLIAQFGSLCNLLQQPRQRESDRVPTVLCPLDVLNDVAKQRKAHIIRLQNKINVTQQHEKEALRVVGHHKHLYEEARRNCEELMKELNHLKEEIAKLKKMLNPMVMSNVLIPQCLNLADLEEVRHYRDPPEGVVKIMDAICLLFNWPPGWESAKQLLGQPSFFEDLLFFDQYSVTKEQLQQLKQIICSPHFLFIPDISKACESLCQWIWAMYQSCCMRQQHFFKQHLEAQAGETKRNLSVARGREKESTDCLEVANRQLLSVKKDLEEQTLQLQKAESIEKELSTSAKQAEMPHKACKATAQEAKLHNHSLVGDALILAAVVSYLDPFGPDIRQELLRKWKKLCHTGIISINPEDLRTSRFENSNTTPLSQSSGFPIPVTERLQLPLCQALGMAEWQLVDTLWAEEG